MGKADNIRLFTNTAREKFVKRVETSALSKSSKSSVAELAEEATRLHRNGWDEQVRAARLETIATGVAIVGIGAELLGQRKVALACAGTALFLAGAEVLTLASEGQSFQAANDLTLASERIRLSRSPQNDRPQ